MCNVFQWNCFNLVYTCNIALILFFKCDVTEFRIPPPVVTQCHTSSTPSAPLMCDVIYGSHPTPLLNPVTGTQESNPRLLGARPASLGATKEDYEES